MSNQLNNLNFSQALERLKAGDIITKESWSEKALLEISKGYLKKYRNTFECETYCFSISNREIMDEDWYVYDNREYFRLGDILVELYDEENATLKDARLYRRFDNMQYYFEDMGLYYKTVNPHDLSEVVIQLHYLPDIFVKKEWAIKEEPA